MGSRSPFESKPQTSSSSYDIVLVFKNTPNFNYKLFFPNKDSLLLYQYIFNKGKEIMKIVEADISIFDYLMKILQYHL